MNRRPVSPMPPATPGRAAPLYHTAYLDLKRRIRCGELTPGSRIGTEQEMARNYGVSVGTIRKTQDLLAQEGLLIKQQGRGTFVSATAASHRRVLWVCGLDVFDGDISPFYTHFLRACGRATQAAGIDIEPAWLSHIRPEDSERLTRDQTSMDYAGYIFVACEFPKHPLLNHVIDRQLPYVHLVHWADEPRTVRIDTQGGLRLGVEQLRSRGCRRIEVMGFHTHLKALAEIITELGVTPFGTIPGMRMGDVERSGYAAIHHRLVDGPPMPDGILMLDDILARGATRAMLQNGLGGGLDPVVAVMSDRRNVIPLGVPVIRLVHDGESAAKAAVNLLQKQWHGKMCPPAQAIKFALTTEAPLDQLRPGASKTKRTHTLQENLR